MNNALHFQTPRTFRERITFDSLRDDELLKRTRLTRPLLIVLRDLLYEDLAHSRRAHALDVETQLIAATIFYASGSFQWCVSSGVGITQSSISRSVSAVTDALCARATEFIQFPTDRADIREIKRGFRAINNFPNVIGCIDGSHIVIKSPSGHEALSYINRKGDYSINVQAVCDHNLIIRDLVARWPGSSHDSYSWRKSSLGRCFDAGLIQDAWLLGMYR